MKHSESISKIAPALVNAQRFIGAAAKDAKNPFYNSSYSDLGSIIAVCKEPLLANGIAVSQLIGHNGDHKPTLETMLLHESGEWFASEMEIVVGKQNDPQAMGSATTYARRYALQAMLLVPSVDDDAEWAEKALRAKPPTDQEAIESMIAQHLEDAAATKDPDRKRKLLGLVADLRLKLQELNDSPTATHTPNGKSDPVTRATEPPATKQEAKPDNGGSVVIFTDGWQNVECHVGLAGGPILGKKVGEMFPTTQTEKHRASLLKWFTNWHNGLTTKTAQDEILWQAIQKAVSVPPQAQSEPPATTETPAQQSQPQAPQRARTGAEWENFVIESKLKKFNGRQLGDLDPDELADFNQKLDGVDWTKATLKQKKTRAMVALALDAIKGEPEPEYTEPQHITELRQNLEKSKIPVEVFMAECVKAGWIDPDRKALEEITETEARPLLEDWETVASQCDGVTV